MTFERTTTIGGNKATMTLDAVTGAFNVSWSRMPDALSENEISQYMNARNRLIGEFAPALNRTGNVLRAYWRASWKEN
jgi:hypothetical protein